MQLKPIPLPDSPKFLPERDVSVIVPFASLPSNTTFQALETWIENSPLEVILVTTESSYDALNSTVQNMPFLGSRVAVTTAPKISKRQQLTRGITEAQGSIIVLADSDVLWPKTLLPYLLAPFEDASVGGVGSRTQIIRGPALNFNSISQFIMHRRFVQRYRHLSATSIADRSVTALSGRTAAYRSDILKDSEFLFEFTHDYWNGKTLLDSADDAFITRWIQEKGWKAVLQVAKEAEIFTFASSTGKLFKQWIRWTRNSKRSFWRYLSNGDIYFRRPYSAVTMVDTILRPFLSIWFVLQLFSKRVNRKTRFRLAFIWIVFGLHQYLSDFENWPISVTSIVVAILTDVVIMIFDIWGMFSLSNATW